MLGWATLFQVFYDSPTVAHDVTYGEAIQYFFLFLQIKPTVAAIFVFSLAALFYPQRYAVFLLLCATLVWHSWESFPHGSNHMIMVFFFSAAVLVEFMFGLRRWRAAGAEGWRGFYDAIAPIGRCILLTMYFFGIFHKINTDFLNPDASCAVALWQQSPFLPDFVRYGLFFHYAAIYGTFIVEGICIALLLGPARTRWLGIVFGIFFHGFIGINGYLFYAPFSLVCMALHVLFLGERTVDRMAEVQKKVMLAAPKPVMAVALAVIFVLIFHGMLERDYTLAKIMFAAVSLYLASSVICLREAPQPGSAAGLKLLGTSIAGAVIATAFFLNGFSPYTGFKTGQSLAMFSNLRTEGGETNHLIMPDGWLTLAPLQSGAVKVVSASTGALKDAAERGLSVTPYMLRVEIERNPGISVTFVQDGKTVHIDGASPTREEDLKKAALTRPEPWWAHKLMNFRYVHDERPVICGID